MADSAFMGVLMWWAPAFVMTLTEPHPLKSSKVVISYLTHVPPLRQGWCWQTDVWQLRMFRPRTASAATSSSLVLICSSLMQPTKPGILPASTCSSEGDGTPPRNVGPKATWEVYSTCMHTNTQACTHKCRKTHTRAPSTHTHKDAKNEKTQINVYCIL